MKAVYYFGDGVADGQFRHPDHRFEFTRAQFCDWATNVAERDGYAVRYESIGPMDEALGSPTQMAVFTREEKA